MISFQKNLKLILLGAFAVCLAVPQFIKVHTFIQVVLNANILVALGSLYSIQLKEGVRDKQAESSEETLTIKEALKFPIYAGGFLLLIYIIFQSSEGDLLLHLFRFQFSLMTAATIAPFVVGQLEKNPARFPKKVFLDKEIVVTGDKFHLYLSSHNLLAYGVGGCLGATYFFTNHWVLNNIIGAIFTLVGIACVKVPKFSVALVLHWLLFLYDIFFVFGTEVMVSVATRMDVPIKLKFPNHPGFSILGLGDLVIPGFLSALCIKFDIDHGLELLSKKTEAAAAAVNTIKLPTFTASMIGYFFGILATMVGLHLMNSGQPALLYIVPAMSIAIAISLVLTKNVKKAFTYEAEVQPEKKDPKKEETKTALPKEAESQQLFEEKKDHTSG